MKLKLSMNLSTPSLRGRVRGGSALLLVFCFLTTSLHAQVAWDKEKYPDYNPIPRINQKEIRQMQQRIKQREAEGKTRPDHWNNAISTAFPPVMNQSAGSCGSASRIYYMFAHELNAARGVSGKLAENIYPTHFTWLLTWVDKQGKEIIAQHNGIPNSEVYDGYTYSNIFGYQDCDDGQNNYGWMQGYDKWFHAMHNRITASANFSLSVEKEEGRELVKNYLWNHCGDESYSTGGIVGIGVASSGNWQKIGKTATNDELGVTGMYYVADWGSSVDHALTIVGYDDRIEFDLNGNGVYGEVDKDEVGAWIIVNSWGNWWCNGGFIYCPYARATPSDSRKGFYQPEYYTPRRDYRPLRTLKVTMDYDHRSEIALYVGVASDLNASTPERETFLRHFYYSGLGKGATRNPAPAIPMLGKWADGSLHAEPMEFGYDLTDLTDGFDTSKPLKYFFRVETESFAVGRGTIYEASIIDYTLDREGLEIPFDLGEEGVAIANAGKKTTITTIAQGESIPAPRNLAITVPEDSEGLLLSWQQPVGTSLDVSTYYIYKDNQFFQSVEAPSLSATVDGDGTYSVSAVYHINGYDVESQRSASLMAGSNTQATTNDLLNISRGGQFTVPAFTTGSQSEYTIEFWVYPRLIAAEMFGIKASFGKFLFKIDTNGCIVIGYDGGDFTTSSYALKRGQWQHIAIAVNGTKMKVYVNGENKINWTSGWNNSGIGGANDLWFGKTEGTTSNYKEIINSNWFGLIDELRIWNYERSEEEINRTYKDTYALPLLQSNLTHYYKMALLEDGETKTLVDEMRRHDAIVTTPDKMTLQVVELTAANHPLANMTASADFTFRGADSTPPQLPVVGKPVTLIDTSSPSTTQWEWNIDGADPETSSVNCPVVIFQQPGTQTIHLKTTNLMGVTSEKQMEVQVEEAVMAQPDFTIPEGALHAGEHFTLLNTTPDLDAYTYKWTLEGAEQEDVRTVNAGATYNAYGDYTVTLTATNTAGSNSVQKTITISKVAPSSAFNIHNNVAIVGEKIYLEDASKYDPSTWTWNVSSTAYTYIVEGQNSSLSIDIPGIYDVSLKTTNEIGTSTINRSRAITVCNADGENGLKFDAEDDEVISGSPFESSPSRFSIQWWMYPGALTEACCGMGDNQNTFWLQVDATGAMTIYKKGQKATTAAGYVIDNEWHHYAITYSTSVFTCYRDGVKFGELTLSGSNLPWEQFRIGGKDAPMNAIIDELQIWSGALTQTNVRNYANAPIEDPTSLLGLMLYYDFNQSSGDVEDKSSKGLTGVRNNFGPDGDAWSSSKGIFFLNFATGTTDVTRRYLKNYQSAFTATTGKYVNGTSRFKKLAMGISSSPWVQENSVVEGDITTEWHVDANKDNDLTLTTVWDGFAEEVKNLKLYQTITLPAGAYELTAERGNYEWNPTNKYLVVAEGTGLPDITDLSSQALGYAICGNACTFYLREETTVSIGLVSTQSGKTCHTIKRFVLKQKSATQIDADNAVGIRETANEVSATATLQAAGGLGCIKILASEPQRVEIFDLSGRLVYSEFIEGQATIRVRKGIYAVGHKKVMVR